MSIFNAIINGLFDVLCLPWGISPLLTLVVVSALAGVLLLILYKHTSPQKTIKKIKDRIKAGLLEIRLFKDDMGVVSGAIGRLFLRDIPSYLGCNIIPLVPLIIVVVPILVQLDSRFGLEPFKAGDEFILEVKLDGDLDPTEEGLELVLPDGLAVETGPVRVPLLDKLAYEIRVEKTGDHEIMFKVRDQEFTKSLAAVPGTAKISQGRYNVSSTSDDLGIELPSILFHPIESPWPSDSPMKSIKIKHHARADMLGMAGDLYPWLIIFCVVGLAFGFALKGVFKVNI